MGERATDESDLDRYLKENLGLSQGINTSLTNPDESEGEQTKKIYEWIGYGGIKEDDPLKRSVAHFYDPVSDQGLNNIFIHSLEWGKSFESNLYSWDKAREYYYLALTSPTEEEREKYWALTFRALGQVLHLVQDLASPAHVRNDNHLPIGDNADPYEGTWGTSPEGISFIHAILAHGALGNVDYQYPVVDFDRFEDYWDTGDGRGLAEFTNSNFVSKDTNVDVLTGSHHYDNPQPTGLYRDPDLFEFTDSDGVRRRINVTYYTSNVVDNYTPERGVNPFNYLTAVSPWDFYTRRYDPDRIHYTLNRKCHEEYAKLLIPRTVGYGAGLLNYFFRGELDVDINIYDGDIHVNNIGKIELYVNNHLTEEIVLNSEKFEVYYDDHNGIRYRIEEITIENLGEETRISFEPPVGAIRYILVYKEEIGEDILVIGKNLSFFVIDTIWGMADAGIVYGSVSDIWNDIVESMSDYYFPPSAGWGGDFLIVGMNLHFSSTKFFSAAQSFFYLDMSFLENIETAYIRITVPADEMDGVNDYSINIYRTTDFRPFWGTRALYSGIISGLVDSSLFSITKRGDYFIDIPFNPQDLNLEGESFFYIQTGDFEVMPFPEGEEEFYYYGIFNSSNSGVTLFYEE